MTLSSMPMLLALLALGGPPVDLLMLDDFGRDDGESALGTRWQSFTDRVMGGVSRGEAAVEEVAGRRALRLRGRVSLENNGGFIQAALPLEPGGATLDASASRGIRLIVRAEATEGYYLHLRTGDTRLPWQHYAAALPSTGEGWVEVEVPFTAFEPRGLRKPLDRSRLVRVGIVAAKRAFDADIAVAEIALYR